MLEKINGPKDIKALRWEELDVLGQEIRQFLIEKISATGGHLGCGTSGIYPQDSQRKKRF